MKRTNIYRASKEETKKKRLKRKVQNKKAFLKKVSKAKEKLAIEGVTLHCVRSAVVEALHRTSNENFYDFSNDDDITPPPHRKIKEENSYDFSNNNDIDPPLHRKIKNK